MNPNDCEMVRVYTRQYTGPDDREVADVTFAHNEEFVVAVEAEAGQTRLNNGGPFRIDLTVRRLTHNTNLVLHYNITGMLGTADWPLDEPKKLFLTDPIKCTHLDPSGDWNDCYEVLAVLTIGVATPDVSFARSPLFVCHEA